MPLEIGKQHELPKRPSEYRTAKGDMNQVPKYAEEEAEQMTERTPSKKTSTKEEPPKPAVQEESSNQ